MKYVTRRHVLGTVTATTVAVSGCSFGREARGGHLFLENRRGRSERVALSVTDRSNGDRPVHHWYRLPDSYALQFAEILDSGNTYDVRAFQPNAPEENEARLSVGVETCDPSDPADALDVSVLVSSNGPDVVVYECDRAYSKSSQLTYVNPSEHRTDQISGAFPTPTAGNRS